MRRAATTDASRVLYGARTPEDILFADDLRGWAADHDIDVEVTVDSGPHAWRGSVGLVTQLIERADVRRGRTLALVCGPEVMMRHSRRGPRRPRRTPRPACGCPWSAT